MQLSDGLGLPCISVRNLDPEFLLNRHYQLDDIQSHLKPA